MTDAATKTPSISEEENGVEMNIKMTTLTSSTKLEEPHPSNNAEEEENPLITKITKPSPFIKSVLLAEGIHHDVANLDLTLLPDRYDRSSYKKGATWFGALLMAGIGMFVQAYVIITTGQIKTLWHDQYPTCWIPTEAVNCPEKIQCCGLFENNPLDDADGTCNMDQINATDYCTAEGEYPDHVQCDEAILGMSSYTEFAGIMLGMLTFGTVADVIGRTKAGVVVAIFMAIGVTVMTFYDDDNLNRLFLVWAIFFGIFGLGVGGEYPLSASNAASEHSEEQEEALLDDEARHYRRILRDHSRTARRGETIAIVFSMQAVGAVVGSLFLIILLYFADQTYINCDALGVNSSGTDPRALSSVWRSLYFIGLIFVFMMLIYRCLVLEEGAGHEKIQARKQRRLDEMHDKRTHKSRFEILRFYAPRLMGTGGAWLVWDVAFYGLNLFSGPIFSQISPGGDLVVINGYLLINNLVALVAVYAGAFVIDIPWIGRKRLQMFSFVMCAILFGITASVFETGSSGTLLALYMGSTFFGNCGANVTTYVMAAETYPTELRATCHGLSAFLGKVGALAGTLAFSHVSTTTIFWICCGVSIAGIFFTFFFSVDLTHVSLAEHDVQLELFLEGRPEAYKGKLNCDCHLSLFEKWRGCHGTYEPGWANELVKESSSLVKMSGKSEEATA